jgi:hypothetical protein
MTTKSTNSTTTQAPNHEALLASRSAALGARIGIATQKLPDLIVGFQASRSPQVRARIEAYNASAVDAYANHLLAGLGI